MKAAALLVLMSASALAAEPVVQEATGEAAIVAGDKAAAKEKAKDDALRRAVEMAVGTMVSAETQTANYQLISDKVLTQASGYVKKYEIVSTKEDGGAMVVTIKATIGTEKLTDDLQGMGLLISRKGKPRLMLMIAEQNIGMSAPAGWWDKNNPQAGGGVVMATDMRIAENTVIDELGKLGFTFVDPEVASGKLSQMGGVSLNNISSQVRQIGDLTGAEIVIVGQAVAKKLSDDVMGVGLISAQAVVTLKALNCDNGEIIATSDANQNHPAMTELLAGTKAIQKATVNASKSLQAKIMEKWKKEVSGTTRITMNVSGIAGYTQLTQFKKALQEVLRGVQEVQQRRMEAGKATLDLQVMGTTDQLAVDIESKPLGKYSVTVTRVTPTTIDVTLKP